MYVYIYICMYIYVYMYGCSIVWQKDTGVWHIQNTIKHLSITSRWSHNRSREPDIFILFLEEANIVIPAVPELQSSMKPNVEHDTFTAFKSNQPWTKFWDMISSPNPFPNLCDFWNLLKDVSCPWTAPSRGAVRRSAPEVLVLLVSLWLLPRMCSS